MGVAKRFEVRELQSLVWRQFENVFLTPHTSESNHRWRIAIDGDGERDKHGGTMIRGSVSGGLSPHAERRHQDRDIGNNVTNKNPTQNNKHHNSHTLTRDVI